jgi:hypothetical protein
MKELKLLIIFSGLVLLAIFISSFIDLTPKKINSSNTTTPTIPINYSNFEKEIAKNGMVKAIPENSEILLRFYNFSTRERVWENSYSLTTASVKKTDSSSADIVLSISSKYLSELTNKNLCQIIQKAKSNGDFGFETELSTTSLAWKFKSMFEYRSCLWF